MIVEKDFAGRQLRGARASQEDACAFSQIGTDDGKTEGLLVVLADGMGGHSAGERASELVVTAFVDAFHQIEGPLSERLSSSLAAADDAIRKEGQHDTSLEGMGSTLVAALVTAAGIEWISVGDSPLYLLRRGTIERLNADHSLRPVLKEMAKSKGVPADDEEYHSSGNILRAALTGEEIEMIDHSPGPISLEEGDLILIATDGIHTLSDQEIAEACAGAEATDASALVEALLQTVTNAANPRQDNVTIAIVKPLAA